MQPWHDVSASVPGIGKLFWDTLHMCTQVHKGITTWDLCVLSALCRPVTVKKVVAVRFQLATGECWAVMHLTVFYHCGKRCWTWVTTVWERGRQDNVDWWWAFQNFWLHLQVMFPKIRRVGSTFCRKLRGSSMPTIDASSTAGTVGQKRGWEDDEHTSGE